MATPSSSGIYVVTLTCSEEVPVTQDPRYVVDCGRVSSRNVKVGKAHNFAARERNYWNDFGRDNVVFLPIAQTEHFQRAETAVLRELGSFRKLSPKDGRMDWLENIELDEVIRRAFLALRREGIQHLSLLPAENDA